MEIVINGRRKSIKEGSNLSELLAGLGLGLRNTAVELNREIVKRADYPSTVLKEGDRLEIVHFVGGG